MGCGPPCLPFSLTRFSTKPLVIFYLFHSAVSARMSETANGLVVIMTSKPSRLKLLRRYQKPSPLKQSITFPIPSHSSQNIPTHLLSCLHTSTSQPPTTATASTKSSNSSPSSIFPEETKPSTLSRTFWAHSRLIVLAFARPHFRQARWFLVFGSSLLLMKNRNFRLCSEHGVRSRYRSIEIRALAVNISFQM